MPEISKLYDRILNYLKDVLSGKERNDLERDMSDDAFSHEAFEGLTVLKGEELEADMDSLYNSLDSRLKKKRSFILSPAWRIAAAVVVLSGLIAVMFVLLRAPEKDLITQKADQPKSAPSETYFPPPPETQAKSEESEEQTDLPGRSLVQQKKSSSSRYNDREINAVVSNQTLEETENIPEAAENKREAAIMADEIQAADSLSLESGYITGRILGVNRKALSGVSLTEEGTGQIAKTDVDGNFRMKVSHPSSTIELSHSGYRDMEVSSKEIAGKEVSLYGTTGPSEEIIVVSLDSRKSDSAMPRAAEKAAKQKSTVDPYKRPLPPGGSMKEFEAWVESRVDTMQLKQLLPGDYRIRVRLTVFKDGKIGNISVSDDIPDIASAEYKDAVSMSDRWQPAMVGNLPVDSDIIIEFSLTVK